MENSLAIPSNKLNQLHQDNNYAYYHRPTKRIPADSKALLTAPRVAIYNWSIKHGVTHTMAYALHDEQGNVLCFTDDQIIKVVSYSRISDIKKDGTIGTSKNWKKKLFSVSDAIKAEWISGISLEAGE